MKETLQVEMWGQFPAHLSAIAAIKKKKKSVVTNSGKTTLDSQ